jgi:phage baseplate assembly protein W
MSGMNRITGKALDGIEHLCQSIAYILTTPLASRVMRRDYGSQLPDLIDHPDNGATRVRFYSATAGALMKYERRLRLSRVRLYRGDRASQAVLDIEGIFVPPGQRSSVLSLRVPLQMGAAS